MNLVSRSVPMKMYNEVPQEQIEKIKLSQFECKKYKKCVIRDILKLDYIKKP
jgi:hypothetical protein